MRSTLISESIAIGTGEELSRTAIEAALVATGADFETSVVQVRGEPVTVYRNAPSTLAEVFGRAASWGDTPALSYEGRTVTWSQYADVVGRVAGSLVGDLGVRPGDRVAVAMRNYPEWALAFAAATSVGAVAVPLNSWWNGEELAYVLADCGATVLFADGERARLVGAQRSGLPVLRTVVEVESEARSGDLAWHEVAAGPRADAGAPAAAIAPDDDATIMYTSGTTGQPKGVVATHRAHTTALMNILYQGALHAAVNRARSEPVRPVRSPSQALVGGPLFHISNLPKLYVAASRGHHLVFMRRWDARKAVALIDTLGLDGFAGVPTMVRQLLDEAEAAGTTLPTLRQIGTGGAPTPGNQIQRIGQQFARGVLASTGYGLTETTGAMVGIASSDFFERPDAAGRPFPVCQVRVVAADGSDAGPGEVGEAWLRGATLAKGYWNRPSDPFHNAQGWFATGDLVTVDDEGFLRIVDRIKDVVLRGGENVYCAEVEGLLATHPDVVDVAVFGIPHDILGEEVAAAVHVRLGSAVTSADLQRQVAQRAAAYKVPSAVVILTGPLPRNPTGKVLKSELRARLQADPALEEQL
ncbi:class I adenylate-forming enzyme family protein [Phytohabitans sp. ZYX-F-186]|uniref:Class I adenylate-forming enzyme family protein n=1 Tax=Phytohabitans maris TaxID=3071409 RepID=A0ABU0ZDW7_9ACTN|nr:class I adenylate-forming enzyme family protein [Phytohabitans sp. ZYX-F-186]MDQ7905232.1 class I adenylate-forming enzyme family protein [Phytohabitans sp. ZYX-F-186]